MDTERKARISVVMLCTGADEGLPRRLESVFGQLGGDDEVLMVFCSKGAEDAIGTAAHDARVETVPETGFPEGLEAALRQAVGDYIFLAESCDTWHPGKRAACVAALEQGAAVVVHDATVVDGDLNELQSSLLERRFRPGALPNLFRNRFVGCCMALRREVLRVALPFPSHLSMPDRWLGAAAGGVGHVAFIGRTLLFYCGRHTAAGRRRLFGAPRRQPGIRELFSFCFVLRHRLRKLRTAP